MVPVHACAPSVLTNRVLCDGMFVPCANRALAALRKRESGLMKQERRMARMTSSSMTVKSSIAGKPTIGTWESLLQAVGHLVLTLRDALVKACTNRPVKRQSTTGKLRIAAIIIIGIIVA